MAGIDDGLADTLIKAVKQYVLDAFGTLTARLDTIELRLVQIPAGARGEIGEKGLQGDAGKPGDKGDQGEPGVKGDQGEPGKPGDKGDQGEPGVKGDQGEPGEPGDKGDQGEPGVKGDQGEPGKPGDKGDQGEPGMAGKDAFFDFPEFWQKTQDSCHAYVSKVLAEWPKPADGAPGKDGKAGERGEKGEPGIAGNPGKDGAPGIKGDAGDPGKDGEQGLPGKDAVFDEEQLFGRLASTLERKLAEQMAALPAPAEGRPGRDGESVHPDTIALMVEQAVQRAIGQIPAAKNGEPGRDAAAIDTLPAVAPDKSYPRGTYAEYRGGTIRSIRQTLPFGDGASLEASGWVVNTNGIDSEEEQLQDDGRTLLRRTVYTNGRVFERSFQFAVVIDRGVWRDGQFKAGDHVSCEGSGWIAQCDTTDRPGKSDAWRLSTKRGRDGKNFDDVGAAKGAPVVRVG